MLAKADKGSTRVASQLSSPLPSLRTKGAPDTHFTTPPASYKTNRQLVNHFTVTNRLRFSLPPSI